MLRGRQRALAATVERQLPDVVVTDIRVRPGRDDEGIVFANRLRTRTRRSGSSW